MSPVFIEKAMEAEGIRPNKKFYSAVIRATGEGGRSDMTLQLLQEMKRLGMKPGVRTFNTAVWACSKVDAVHITGTLLRQIEVRTVFLLPRQVIVETSITRCSTMERSRNWVFDPRLWCFHFLGWYYLMVVPQGVRG